MKQQVNRLVGCSPVGGQQVVPFLLPLPCLATVIFVVKDRCMVLQAEPKSVQILAKDGIFFSFLFTPNIIFLLNCGYVLYILAKFSRRYNLSFLDLWLFMFVEICMALDQWWGFS